MSTPPSSKRRFPLSLQVVLAVVAGSAFGALFGSDPIAFGLSNEVLGELGLLVVRVLKALAVPLVLFAVVDGLVSTRLSSKGGLKLLTICGVNALVALTIGLGLMNLLEPGKESRERFSAFLATSGAPPPSAVPADALSPLKAVQSYVPESLVKPFLEGSVIPVVLLALLVGLALRKLEGQEGIATVTGFVRGALKLFTTMLEWVVHAVPFALFGLVAQVVGRAGLSVFAALAPFVGVVLLGFLLHGVGYYLLAGWALGGRRPGELLAGASDAVLTGIAANSSLAAMPVTLRCLTGKLGVSPAASRLAACIGTNLNNDGITLYEAMAVLFVAQALGLDLSLAQQAGVMAAAVMAGVGIAGIPEAGLVMLPLVLGSIGLSPTTAALAMAFVLPVDWLLARCRTAMNVMSDTLVAVLLDAGEGVEARAEVAVA